jgi:hypothetical protein
MPKLKADSPKKAKPRKPKILVLGAPGVGKTWGSLEFPTCYYIDCEGGASLGHYTDKLTESGGAYLGPDKGADDFAVVIEQVQALATNEHEYRTLVIDSFSHLFNTAVAAEVERMIAAKEKQAFGNQKLPAVRDSRRLVHWLNKLDMTVLLICHEKAKWEDGEQTGHTFDGWDKLEYELDLSLQVVKQGPKRMAVVGKSRLKEFTTAERFPWGYASFAERCGASVLESSATSVELATADQVERVESLAKALKLDPAKQAKWFTAAGVDNWREMDTETIAKCIGALAKEIEQPQAA